MFDEETEQLAGELGLEVAFPSAVAAPPAGLEDRDDAARQRGGRAERAEHDGRRATDYAALLALADGAGLGDDLVVQTPYGDSGQTTFFIADEADWDEHGKKIVGHDIKVMRRIDPRELRDRGRHHASRHAGRAADGRAHRVPRAHARTTAAGAATTSPPSCSPRRSAGLARERTVAMGERLRREGYRGYFELDFLADADTGEM